MDNRDLYGKASFNELSGLASDLGNLGMDPSFRLAVLHRPRVVEAGFVAEIARDQGWQVAAFDNFEDAFLWLND